MNSGENLNKFIRSTKAKIDQILVARNKELLFKTPKFRQLLVHSMSSKHRILFSFICSRSSQNERILWPNLRVKVYIAITTIFFIIVFSSISTIEDCEIVRIYFHRKWGETKKNIGIQRHNIGLFKLFCLNCFRILILNEFFTGMFNKNEKSTTQLLFFDEKCLGRRSLWQTMYFLRLVFEFVRVNLVLRDCTKKNESKI